MVEYMDAIKKPFMDMKTFLIGGLIGAIPFVNVLVNGYSLNVSRMTQNGDKSLPAWSMDSLVNYIVDFLKYVLVGIIYSIPAIILLGATGLTLIMSVISGDVNAIMAALAGAGLILIIAVILGLIGLVFASMGIQFMIKENKIMSAFKFGGILKKLLTAKYWITIIVYLGYGFVLSLVAGFISMILAFIPFLGWIIAMFIFGLMYFALATTMMTLMAEVFNETP